MRQEIRHPRLIAFYESKILNSMMLVVLASLFIMGWSDSILLPGILIGTALLFFTGYTLWFWIKKPKRIIVNTNISNIAGFFTLYFLIIVAIKAENEWWYIFPLFAMVCALFAALITAKDRVEEL